MRRLALALLFLPVLVAAQSLPPKAAVLHVADSLAAAFLADHQSPSVAVALVRGRDTLVFSAWGKADLENDIAASPRSVYRVGSVTKQFTSAAVMQLVEQGKVKLEDSIAAFLPALPAAWRGVTVRQLLNHTSGIPSYTDIGPSWVRRWGEQMRPDTILALVANTPMGFAPGTSWHYNNTGYVLLGMLIEKVANHSWGVDLQERFFKPLGLADTRNCLNVPLVPRRAQGYQPAGNGWTNAPYLAMSQPYAAGALCSTIGDLVTWNRALHTGKVVSAASYAMMTTPEGAAAKAALKYGFGLGRDTLAGRPVITHGGGINGFITANVWLPDGELSVTVLTNSGAARADRLMAQLVRAAVGVPLLKSPAVVATTAAQRARYLGVYALAFEGAARDFTVTERDGQLFGQLAGQEPLALLYYGNDTWGAAFDPDLRLTFSIRGEQASSLTLRQGGGDIGGHRKP